MFEHVYALIMAGGAGTRLWPLSRQNRPKQALPLFNGRSLFALTVDRLLPWLPPERIGVLTNREQMEPLREQAPLLPVENFILEPEGRGTAACIALGALHLVQRDPEALMIVLPADHYIRYPQALQAALQAALKVAEEDYLVTLGITPTFPATGYGYIRQGEALARLGDLVAYVVQQFVEKPAQAVAEQYLASGVYTWNSGMFIWKARRILEEIARYLPELGAAWRQWQIAWGTPEFPELLAGTWHTLPKISIDYGVMERAQRVAVIPVEMGWSDVGSWDTLLELLADADGCFWQGDVLALGAERTLGIAAGGRKLVVVDVQDLVIVDTPDAILILPRGAAQRVRDVVQQLQQAGETKLLE